MSRYRCRRCEWEPEVPGMSREELVEHAIEAQHPLCCVCHRSLGQEEYQTCLPCIADAKHRLASIVEGYALLPATLEVLPSPSDWRRSGSRSTDTTLPGGDALSLLSPGSAGRWAQGQPHNASNLAADPPSVAFELSRWEDDWREVRGEGGADARATVTGAVSYLMPRMTWAAETHPAFTEFAADLKRLLSRLQTATATMERDDTGAACHQCGIDLRRSYAPGRPCHHRKPDQALRVVGYTEHDPPRPIHEPTINRDGRLTAWAERHAHCDQGGQSDSWHCPRCQRIYTAEEYRLAVAAEMRLRKDSARSWVPLSVAARLVGRTYQTVRRWVENGEVEQGCDLETKRSGVWLPSVFLTDDQRKRRKRAA